METSVIAVRIANGSYVPILKTDTKTRRRLVLTTAKDNQTNVQIDLYRGSSEQMLDADYIGSLVINDIAPAAHGEPDIALLVGVDPDGNLNATATDKTSGEYQSLSVGLEALEAGQTYDVPDFELSDAELTMDELTLDEEEISLEDEEITLEDAQIESGSDAPKAEAPKHDSLEVPTHGFVVEERENGEYDAVSSDRRGGEGDDTEEIELDDLAGLEGFDDDAVGFDASFAEAGASLDDLPEGTDSQPSLEAELMARGTRRGGSEEETLSSLEEGIEEAELGDEDFSFDEPDGAEGTIFDEAAAATTSDDISFGDEPPGDDEAGMAQLDSLEDESPEEPSRYDEEAGEQEEAPLAPRRSNALIFLGYIILALAALGVVTYLVFRLLEGPAAPPLHALRPDHLASALPALLLPGRHRTRRSASPR